MAPKVRVLLTNDDGPPGSKESPYVFSFARALEKELGWDVKVVVPASQKSWIGKAYHIKEVIKGKYYYPREPDGLGESSDVSRPLKPGECAEWVLLDGTPATCTNIALHNLYPGEIDLVISGPNYGRNSSSGFMLSSGTIGAALSSSLTRVRSIAVSYATFHYPTPPTYTPPAHVLACSIIGALWANWGPDPHGLRGEVDLYTINVPMIEGLLAEKGMEAMWTRAWRNGYGRLFRPAKENAQKPREERVRAAGPDAPPESGSATPRESSVDALPPLTFNFSPDMEPLIRPKVDELPEGTDTWALHHGFASVCPLRASFAEPGEEALAFAGESGGPGIKLKL